MKEIADMLGVTTRAAQIRAARGEWPVFGEGRERHYLLTALPIDVQAAWYGAEISQSICKKNGDADTSGYLENLPLKKRENVILWLRRLHEFDQYSRAAKQKTKQKLRKAFCQSYRARHPDEESFSPGKLKRKVLGFKREGLKYLEDKYGKVKNFASWPDEAKACLKQQYLHINSPPITFCVSQLKIEAKKKGWSLPSPDTMRRFLDSIDPETRDYYRRGEKYWKQHYLPSKLRDYELLEPNEVWVADHRQFNVAVRLPSGKTVFPWITAFLDMKSRMVVGYELCEIPSSDSIRLAFRKGIEKFGTPEHVIIDNGRDFSCRLLSGKAKRCRLHLDELEFTGIFLQLGIGVHFCIPGNPQSKSVERFFWTVETHFDVAFMTYRGNNISNRPEGVDSRIKSGKHTIEWEDLFSFFDNWVTSYNGSSHRGHGMRGRSPVQVWNEYFKNHEQKKVLPASLRLLLMRGGKVKVGRFGVQAFGNFYRDDIIMGRVSQYVIYRYDPEDLSRLHVYALDDSYLSSPQQMQRTPWQDEAAYVDIKKLEKRKRQAIKAEREASEAIYKAELGYQMRDPGETAEPAKILRVMRTPFDGLQKKIDSEEEAKSATAGAAMSGFRARFQYNDQSFGPDEDVEGPNLELVSTNGRKGKILRSPWGKGV